MPAPWARGAEVRIIGSLHGAETVSVLHFATNTVVSDGPQLDEELLELADAVAQCVITTLLPVVTLEWTFKGVEAVAIVPVRTDPVVFTANAGAVGARGPTSMSTTAFLVNKRTGGGGRRGRGKMFLPPPGEDDVTGSIADADVLLLLVEFLACLAGKFTGANPTTNWRLGVYSKTNDDTILGTFDNSFREVTQLSPNPQMSTLRSRRVGVGS